MTIGSRFHHDPSIISSGIIEKLQKLQFLVEETKNIKCIVAKPQKKIITSDIPFLFPSQDWQLKATKATGNTSYLQI